MAARPAPGAGAAPPQSMDAFPERPLSRTCGVASTSARRGLAADGPDRLAQRARRGQHGRRLVAAVRHAVGAAGDPCPGRRSPSPWSRSVRSRSSRTRLTSGSRASASRAASRTGFPTRCSRSRSCPRRKSRNSGVWFSRHFFRRLAPRGAGTSVWPASFWRIRYDPTRTDWRMGIGVSRRTSLGRPNRIDSVVVTCSETETGPRPPSAEMISCTTAGGAEAPAVRPMVDAPASQPSWMSSALSIR